MKKLFWLVLAGLLCCFVVACDDDDDNGGSSNPSDDYTYKCDFTHPFSGDAACKGLVGVTTQAKAEEFCSNIVIGGVAAEPGTVSKGACDLAYNGYCIGPDGIYTFSGKSPGADVKTNEDDCDPKVNLSSAWGCEEGPKINGEPVGTFVCTL